MGTSWLSLLLSSAKYYLNASGPDRIIANKLSRKHGKNFLSLPNEPIFGLHHRGDWVGLIQHEDDKVRFLRKIAEIVSPTIRIQNCHMFIRYKRFVANGTKSVFEYAGAVPS
jgi:hypothetical protein